MHNNEMVREEALLVVNVCAPNLRAAGDVRKLVNSGEHTNLQLQSSTLETRSQPLMGF